MKFDSYKDMLKQRLLKMYDLEEEKVLGKKKIDLFGSYHLRTERYIATKKAVVYGMENNEYICLFYLPVLTKELLQEHITWVKEVVDEIVRPHKEHMSSALSLVLVLDKAPSEALQKEIRNTKFHKGYSFGFRGWVDLKLLVYSLEDQSLITNKKGKEGSEVYTQS